MVVMDRSMSDADPHHGVKRPAEEELEDERRLTRRLGLLNIHRHHDELPPSGQTKPATDSCGSSMQLDDTKHRVYVYNLDDELAEDDHAEEEKLVFLPDIDQRLTKIPKLVLASHHNDTAGREMVLYNVPHSLSVPEEQDAVRKAIIETRIRAQEGQAHERERPQAATEGGLRPATDEDTDAMQID